MFELIELNWKQQLDVIAEMEKNLYREEGKENILVFLGCHQTFSKSRDVEKWWCVREGSFPLSKNRIHLDIPLDPDQIDYKAYLRAMNMGDQL